jgi:hypothetical protein
MPAAEAELKRIATDESHGFELKVGLWQLGDLLQPPDRAVALAAAFRAGAGPAQHPGRVAGLVAVPPGDAEQLAVTVEVDGDRERVEP